MVMKKLLSQTLALILVFLVAACSQNAAETQDPEVTFTEKTVEGTENTTVALMSIEGMSCEVGCAKYINGKLNKTEGVLASEVVFDENIAKVTFDPALTNAKDLAKMVAGLNDGQYKVSGVEVIKTVKSSDTSINSEQSKAPKSSKDKVENVKYDILPSITFPNIFNVLKLRL
jgi:periplasmic mercuric ion binding protein